MTAEIVYSIEQIRARIDEKVYENKVPCPEAPQWKTFFDVGKTKAEFDIAMTEHWKRLNDWREGERQANMLFRDDICRSAQASTGLPKKICDNVYWLAWEEGHSSGYSEVVTIFETLLGIFDREFVLIWKNTLEGLRTLAVKEPFGSALYDWSNDILKKLEGLDKF